MNGRSGSVCVSAAVMIVGAIGAVSPQRASAQQDPTTLVSVNLAGLPGNGASKNPALTPDARFIVFESTASDLVVGDANGVSDIFVRDLLTGVTTRVSVSSAGVEGNDDSRQPAISADGRLVAFDSQATNFAPADIDTFRDVFLHDRVTGTTVQVSVSPTGEDGNRQSSEPHLSADGTHVAFRANATNLVTTLDGIEWDVYVRNLTTQVTVRVSDTTDGPQGIAAGSPTLSDDGSRIAWEEDYESGFFLRWHDLPTSTTTTLGETGSEAPMISGDGQVIANTWLINNFGARVIDLDTEAEEIVSVTPTGETASASGRPSLSADQRFVAFISRDSDLWPVPLASKKQVFVRDRLLQQTALITASTTNLPSNGDVGGRTALSADGRYVAYSSVATDLVPGDGNGVEDVFVHAPLEPWTDLGFALPGAGGAPELKGVGPLLDGTDTHLVLTDAAPSAAALLFASLASLPAPFKGGTLAATPPLLSLPLVSNGAGEILLSFAWPPGVPAATALTLQYGIADAGAVKGVALSNAVQGIRP